MRQPDIKNYIYASLLYAAMLSLLGCAATKHYDLSQLYTPATVTFVVIDNRPAQDKSYKTGCGYREPVDYIGDDNFKPAPMDILKAVFEHQLGERLEGKTIEITKFQTMIVYPFSCRRAMVGGVAAVSLPAAIGAQSGGTDDTDSIAVYIEGTVEGGMFQGTAMIPIDPVIPLMGGWNVRNEDIRAAIAQALNNASKNIGNN